MQKLALSYAYNNAQQITSLSESIEGDSQTYTFAYDQRDQLTNETVAGDSNVYSYDQAQNRVAAVRGGTVNETYGYSIANKMTNIWRGSQSASSRYWYDLAGNLSTGIV